MMATVDIAQVLLHLVEAVGCGRQLVDARPNTPVCAASADCDVTGVPWTPLRIDCTRPTNRARANKSRIIIMQSNAIKLN